MNAYLVDQTQQMERAKTFAEIRRIEERVSSSPGRPRYGAALSGRSAPWPPAERAVMPCEPLSRCKVPVEAGGIPGL